MKTLFLDEPQVQESRSQAGAKHEFDEFAAELYSPDRKREWDDFVSSAKNATFLFYRDYMDYHQDRFADHSLMIFRRDQLVGLLPANLNAEAKVVSHEGLTYGGLVVRQGATLCEVLACFRASLLQLHNSQIEKLVYKQIPAFYNAL